MHPTNKTSSTGSNTGSKEEERQFSIHCANVFNSSFFFVTVILIAFAAVGEFHPKSDNKDRKSSVAYKRGKSSGLATIIQTNEISQSSTGPPQQQHDAKTKEFKKFFVFSQQRSGSGYLVSLLDSHSNLHCGGELLRGRNIRNLPFDKYFRMIEQKSDKLRKKNFAIGTSPPETIASSSTLAPPVGFKIMYDQGILMYGAKLITELDQRRYKVVHLVRRNKLFQYVSNNSNIKDMQIKVNGHHVAHPKTEEEASQLVNITIDSNPMKLLTYMRRMTKEVNEVSKLLDTYLGSRNYHEVDYEKLVDNTTNELALLQTFLGQRIEDLSTNFTKIHKAKRTREYFPESGQEEVRKALERSEFSWVLDGW